MPLRLIAVATDEVPTASCLVPTANLLLSAVFTVVFLIYFNYLCHQMSKMLISRLIKQRLRFVQLWYTVSLPVLWIDRLLLIIGFGFARHFQFSPDTFTSGLIASRALLDVQFGIILVSSMVGIHALIWRPLHEIHVLNRPRRKLLYVSATAVQGSAEHVFLNERLQAASQVSGGDLSMLDGMTTDERSEQESPTSEPQGLTERRAPRQARDKTATVELLPVEHAATGSGALRARPQRGGTTGRFWGMQRHVSELAEEEGGPEVRSRTRSRSPRLGERFRRGENGTCQRLVASTAEPHGTPLRS